MKKLSVLLAVLIASSAFFTACGGSESNTTTAAGTNSEAPAATTQAPATAAPDVTDDPNGDEPDDPDEPDYDVEAFPNAKSGDTALEGYQANGYWYFEDGKGEGDGNSNLFVFTNDTMASGKLTATFTSKEGSNENDNGIVFGLEEVPDGDSPYFWESGPSYYFLFVSDAGTLYLAKVSYLGQAWNVLEITADVIPGYVHGATITISAEFDGNGSIKCYANDELLIDYTDPSPLSGVKYGVRCEVAGVVYESVVAEHN